MTTGQLLTSDADFAALAAAESLIVLVGGFDGSGNFGDILQTRSAIDRVVAAKSPGLAVAVVVEDAYADSQPWTEDLFGDVALLRYSESVDSEREPRPIAALPTMTALYLTGGGYLNEYWGARKLSHVAAVEALVDAGSGRGFESAMASGLQISPHDGLWRWQPVLGRSRPLLVRDPGSAGVLSEAGISQVAQELGDDALQAISCLDTVIDDPSCVNVHLNVQSYSSDAGSARIERLAALLLELAGRVDGLTCQLLIAFDDDRIGERVAADELVAACDRAADAANQARIRFRTTSLPQALRARGPVALGGLGTISCSYHVGLLSLWHHVPTLLFAENSYYRQKMRGLLELFGLPDDLIIDGPHEATVEQRLAIAATGLRSNAATARDRLRLRVDAADAMIGQAVATHERDANWARLQDLLPTYRNAVSESADLHRRIAVIGGWLEQERKAHEATLGRLKAERRSSLGEADAESLGEDGD